MLPDGSYAMSQTQVAQAVGKAEYSIRRFMAQNDLEALPGNGYESGTIEISKDWTGRGNRQSIKAVPIAIASEFWLNQAVKGNSKALAMN